MKRTEILAKIADTVRSPFQPIREWQARTGGKVVGVVSCMPPFAPEELIHAAGLLPVGIWGGEVAVSLADAQIQSFACSVARTSLEMALKGTFSVCDAFLFPFTCDAFQNLSEIWKSVVRAPCFQMVFPKKVDQGKVNNYLEKELLRLKGQLEAFSGAPITEKRLRASIRLYNESRSGLRKLDSLRARRPGCLSAAQMMQVVLASTVLPREEHAALVRGLIEDSGGRDRGDDLRASAGADGVPVILTGIMPRPAAIASLLDELGFRVLGDDLGLGSLYYSLDMPDTGNGSRDLAHGYLTYPACSTLHNPSARRSESLLKRVRDTGAEGLLILATKFCEPEFFDYPYLKEDLEGAGVPVLLLETELGMGAPGQIRTRLEAFAETVKGKRKG